MKKLSKRNPYWIEHNRYLELKYFCLQYPIWCKALAALDSLSKRPMDLAKFKTVDGMSPTERCVLARESYLKKITMIQEAATEAANDLDTYILIGATEGKSYDTINANQTIPCCREVYYENYRKFFYILNKLRE